MFSGDNAIYVVYAAAALCGIMIAETAYLLLARGNDRRDAINRRMRLKVKEVSQRDVLLQLRKERGLENARFSAATLKFLQTLRVQSGLSMALPKFLAFTSLAAAVISGLIFHFSHSIAAGVLAFPLLLPLAPFMTLRRMRKRRHKIFGVQLPEALDLITRGLKAGHPVPVALAMVGREMPDPVGTEFGLVADEITYGSDMVTALAGMYERVGQEDLPLFVTAVSIQSTTGGNLREILDGLSQVIRGQGQTASQDQGDLGGRPHVRNHSDSCAGCVVDRSHCLHAALLRGCDRQKHDLVPVGICRLLAWAWQLHHGAHGKFQVLIMEAFLETLAALKPDNSIALVAAMLLAGFSLLGWSLYSNRSDRQGVKQRLRIDDSPTSSGKAEAPKRAESIVSESTLNKAREFYAKNDPESVARLRMKLVQAGFMAPGAVGYFLVARFALLVLFAVGAFAWTNFSSQEASAASRWGLVIFGAALGYFAPSLWLSQQARARLTEYRHGFPDFMDLMIVCADAGMSS